MMVPMKVLAIDATEDACSAALMLGNQKLFRYELAPQRHSELLLSMMDELLREADVALNQLDGLAFARGPGSFTGLRIAAGVVQGAALGAGLPVVPVSSLAALALAASQDTGCQQVLAALDARMDEVYAGLYQLGQSGQLELMVAETVSQPQALNLPLIPGWVGIGSGFDAYAEALALQFQHQPAGQILAGRRPHAMQVAELGRSGLQAGLGVDAELAVPVYIRDRVAEKPKKQYGH